MMVINNHSEPFTILILEIPASASRRATPRCAALLVVRLLGIGGGRADVLRPALAQRERLEVAATAQDAGGLLVINP